MRLTVIKDGFAGMQSPRFTVADADPEKLKVVDPIRLEARRVTGRNRGRSSRASGGWGFCSNQSADCPSGLGWNAPDDAYRRKRAISLARLRRGVVGLYVFHEKVRKSGFYLADGTGAIRVKLPERMDDPRVNLGASAHRHRRRWRWANRLPSGKLAPGPISDRASWQSSAEK